MEFLTEWSARDRGLATALTVLEDSVHACGHDLERSTHPDMGGGWYEVDDTMVCEACAALEKWRAETENPEPGVMPVVVDTRPENRPLPPRSKKRRPVS